MTGSGVTRRFIVGERRIVVNGGLRCEAGQENISSQIYRA
jgi:hypothetical protein